MPKGMHADFERIKIDEELYLLKYADGRLKVVLKEGTLTVTEVMTRSGESTPGSHVFMSLKRGTHPKPDPWKRKEATSPVGLKWRARGFGSQEDMEAFEARSDFPGWDAL